MLAKGVTAKLNPVPVIPEIFSLSGVPETQDPPE